MNDYYRVPTLALLCMLVAVFAALYARHRTQRRLLWLIGWTMAVVRLAALASEGGQGSPRGGFLEAISHSAMLLAAVMFLGSLSPVAIGQRIRVSYVILFSPPLVFFAFSTAFYPSPGRFLHLLNVLAAIVTLAIAFHWSLRRHLLPVWFTTIWSLAVGLPCVYLAWNNQNELVIRLAHSGISLVTALLVLAEYRRLTPGVLFTASGFFAWSLPVFMEFSASGTHSLWLPAIRLLNLMKVMTAVGMVVLVLEDEARDNEAAQIRDRRARAEMEQYSKLDLSIEPHHDFGIQYSEVCCAIAAASRFHHVVILLQDVERKFRVAASSAGCAALAAALDSVGKRWSEEEVQKAWRKSKRGALRPGNVSKSDLRPWIRSGDDADLLNFTNIYSVPITARSGDLQGVLMLSELKDDKEALLPEDLLPLELLIARVAAARESGLLLRRVAQSEKLAGIGQLAGGVAHELNNPLTVVMGYAELIQESASEERIRNNAAIIRSESHRMKQIIESLARFWKPSPSPIAPVGLPQLMTAVDALRRQDYERSGIAFEVVVAPDLPNIFANGDQVRQVLLQILDNAAAAVIAPNALPEKRIHMEAGRTGDHIQIVITDSGPGFPNPDRVFDPFFTIKPPGDGPALALSLCYSIVREQGGDMSAQNLNPHGAAVVIDLPIESPAGKIDPSQETVVR